MKKSTFLLCTFVLGASMFVLGQQTPSSAPPGSTPPTFPSDQSRPAPDTTAPVPQTAPDASSSGSTTQAAPDASKTTPDASSSSTSSTTSTQTASQDSSAAGAQTISGCLSQASSGGGFTLTDSTGASFILQGDTSKLAKHVGEQVEVHGTASPSSSSSSSATAPSSSASPAGANDTSHSTVAGSSASTMLNVQSISKIASTCASQQPSK